jgi:hypothetical protein
MTPREELTAPIRAVLAAMNENKQRTDRNRGTLNVRLRFVIMELADYHALLAITDNQLRFYQAPRTVVNIFCRVATFRGAHAPRVLALASSLAGTLPQRSIRVSRDAFRKIVSARRRNHHARRVRSPIIRVPTRQNAGLV